MQNNKLTFIEDVINDDCKIIYKWIKQERISKFLSSDYRLNKINENMLKIITKKKDCNWNIFSFEKKKLGCVIIDGIDFEDKIGNLWYFIGEKDYLRKNFIYYTISEILDLNKFKLNAVTAWVSSNNKASINLLTKLKFKKIGIIKKTFKIKKIYNDRILFYRTLIELNEKINL